MATTGKVTSQAAAERLDLTRLLVAAAQRLASEPLDRVYAIIGLLQQTAIREAMLSSLRPDYGANIRDVYTAATKVAVESRLRNQKRDALALLRLPQRLMTTTDTPEAETYPSWVPRLHHAYDHNKGSPGLLRPPGKSADLGCPIALPAQFANQPAVLRCWGFVIDEIQHREPKLSSDHEDSAQFAAAFLRIKDCAIASSHTDAQLASTLTQGKTDRPSDATNREEQHASYKAFLEDRDSLAAGDDTAGFSAAASWFRTQLIVESTGHAFFTTTKAKIGIVSGDASVADVTYSTWYRATVETTDSPSQLWSSVAADYMGTETTYVSDRAIA
ncbi:hypothetical protein Slin15195_G037750 [Septoria linicola]|uniref:Uncharacterized protein n=1 Tax=Septoria linicola TaxID=215465 RepID=A0A9Q9ATH8_9PEZI|nr:hypothetical protein Slin15195_G037750 [Septoria linicola]